MTKEYYGIKKLQQDRVLLAEVNEYISKNKNKFFLISTPEKNIHMPIGKNGKLEIYNLDNEREEQKNSPHYPQKIFFEQLEKYRQCFKQGFDIEKEKTLNEANAFFSTIYYILKTENIELEIKSIDSLQGIRQACYMINNSLHEYFNFNFSVINHNVDIADSCLELTKYNYKTQAVFYNKGIKLNTPLVLSDYLNFLLHLDYHKKRFDTIRKEMEKIFEKGSKFNLGGVR